MVRELIEQPQNIDLIQIVPQDFLRGINYKALTPEQKRNRQMIRRLKMPGFNNEPPDLSRLEQGDLIYRVDFKNIYSEVLKNFLNTDPVVVFGRKYPKMNLL